MSDDVFRPPLGGEDADDRDRGDLPEHEIDDDTTVGGGLMGTGATATDRGTGELTGRAEGAPSDEDDDDLGGLNEGAIAGAPAGSAQAYVPAFIEDDDREGGSLPDA